MRHILLGTLAAVLASAGPILADEPIPKPIPAPGAMPGGNGEGLPAPGTYLEGGMNGGMNGGCAACGMGGCCYGMDLMGAPIYGGIEALYMWTRVDNSPVLLTSGPTGVLGEPNTVILFGGTTNNFQSDPHPGVRIWMGARVGCGAMEVGYLRLENFSEFVSFSSDGSATSPALFRPRFLNGFGEFASAIAFPGAFSGTFAAQTSTELWGAEANYAFQFFDAYAYRYEFITGFRYMSLDQDLFLNTLSSTVAGIPASLAVSDRFSTANRFYGGQIGLRGMGKSGPLYFELKGLIALGFTHREVEIAGNSTLTIGGASASAPVGLLAASTNIGKTSSDQWDILPEISVKFGYEITPNVTATIGYTFLYWGNTFQPGSQIDVTVGPDQPARIAPDRDFWAQGVTAGLQINW